MTIRPATPFDMAAVNDLRNSYVRSSTAIYTEEETSLEDRQAWLHGRDLKLHPVIVATEGDEPIYMVLPKGRGQVVFRVRDVEVVSQLIDGTFPDFQQIIPRSYKSRTLVSTSSLLKACKQAEIFAREGSNVARLNIKSAQSEMQPSEVEISATSEETGKNETIVEATVDGSGLLIAFNVKFLREALEVIRTPNVALETSAPNAPGVVRPVGDDQFLHVIMPMHLG